MATSSIHDGLLKGLVLRGSCAGRYPWLLFTINLSFIPFLGSESCKVDVALFHNSELYTQAVCQCIGVQSTYAFISGNW